MRPLSAQFRPYGWALSTDAIARLAGIPPERVLRFDGNTPHAPPPYANAETVALELSRINTYPHGGFPQLVDAIAAYAGAAPENIVLGAGADDLIKDLEAQARKVQGVLAVENLLHVRGEEAPAKPE